MKRQLLLLTVLLAPIALGLGSTMSLAQAHPSDKFGADIFREVCNGKNPNNGSQNSSVCKDSKPAGNPLTGPNGIITIIINVTTIVLGIAAVITIILGGLKLITSGNNPQEVGKAREMILYALLGIFLALTAQLMVRVFLGKLE